MFRVPPKFCVLVCGPACGVGCVCVLVFCVGCVLCGFKIQNFATGSFFPSKTPNPAPPPLDVPMSSGFISFFFDFQINNFNMAAGMRPQLCCAAFPALLCCPLLCCAVLSAVGQKKHSTEHREHSIINTALLCWCFRTVVERNLQRCNQIFNIPSRKLPRLDLMKTRRYH
jgi:hypothetical protein